jgi:hypothetical protein
MKDSPVLMILLAVLAVVGTLGGVWLGHYLERDNEVFKWRRDHALEAYSEVIKAVEAVRNAADISYFSYFNGPCVTEQHAKHMGIVADKLAELLRVAQTAKLVAPDAVNGSISILRDHMGEVAAKSNDCPKIEDSERKAMMSKFSLLLSQFLNEARNDIGVHPPLYAIDTSKK